MCARTQSGVVKWTDSKGGDQRVNHTTQNYDLGEG